MSVAATLKKDESTLIMKSNINLFYTGQKVLARLMNFVCSATASDSWRDFLQQDSSLLITCVCKFPVVVGKFLSKFAVLNYIAFLTQLLMNRYADICFFNICTVIST